MRPGWFLLLILMNRNVLAVFARYPEPGKVKTRIARRLGGERACRIYKGMLERLLARHRGRSYDLVVFLTPPEKAASFSRENRVLTLDQQGEDLGERMADAFRRLLRKYEGVAVAGSDVPGLTPARVEEAFAGTTRADVVLGPCPDGGYYLIASRQTPEAFADIPWSTPDVLERTVARLRSRGQSLLLLPEERDVDEVEDLHLLGPQASVIIPITGGDEPEDRSYHAFNECVVVDGGAVQGIGERARAKGARVIASPRGRAVQMNMGAQAAKGDVLLFLHADTKLPPNAEKLVLRAIERGAIGGCFETAFDEQGALLRMGDAWRNLRARWLGEFYGDQSIFIRRDVFFRIGGFRDLGVMEDYDLCLRMRHAGRLAYIPARAHTSARRYIRKGIVRTWLKDQLTKARFFLKGCLSGRRAPYPPSSCLKVDVNLRPICAPLAGDDVTPLTHGERNEAFPAVTAGDPQGFPQLHGSLHDS